MREPCLLDIVYAYARAFKHLFYKLYKRRRMRYLYSLHIEGISRHQILRETDESYFLLWGPSWETEVDKGTMTLPNFVFATETPELKRAFEIQDLKRRYWSRLHEIMLCNEKTMKKILNKLKDIK